MPNRQTVLAEPALFHLAKYGARGPLKLLLEREEVNHQSRHGSGRILPFHTALQSGAGQGSQWSD